MDKQIKFLSLCLEGKLNDYKLDSEAHSYLVSSLLKKADIPHSRVFGFVKDIELNTYVDCHFWNVLGDKDSPWIIDYRLPSSKIGKGIYDRVPDTPFGIFNKNMQKNYKYNMNEIEVRAHEIEALNAMTDDEYSSIELPELFLMPLIAQLKGARIYY